jgi:hypothetical protein
MTQSHRNVKAILPICLSSLVLTTPLTGARGESFRTDINPALLYYRALLMPVEPISDADWTYLASKKGQEQKLPERFGAIISGFDNQFTLVRQAAHATVPCDWGIDLSPGPNIHLPHLGRIKTVCRTAQVRAVWALQQGRPDDARDDLLAAFVLGRNAANDGLLISALVQFAIEALDCGTVAQHFGEFPAETLRQLVEGFDAAPARHTMADCVPTEKYGFYDWQISKILELQKAHPKDNAKVMAGFRESGVVTAMEFVGYTNFWPRLVAASGGTSDGVLRLLREEEPLLSRVAMIMALPPPEYETQANQFLADIRGSPNPFITALDLYFSGLALGGGPKFQVRAREFRAQAQLAMVQAAVEYRLHGESGLKSVMDPFGNGPFGFKRFMFGGVDRGFELKSASAGADAPFVMIFVEKGGPAFQVIGPDAGKAITQ